LGGIDLTTKLIHLDAIDQASKWGLEDRALRTFQLSRSIKNLKKKKKLCSLVETQHAGTSVIDGTWHKSDERFMTIDLLGIFQIQWTHAVFSGIIMTAIGSSRVKVAVNHTQNSPPLKTWE
jgi:hypothetical protein